MAGWLVGWDAAWLAGMLAGWLAECLAGWMDGWLVGRKVSRVIHLVILVILIILVILKSVNVTGICNMAIQKCCTVAQFGFNSYTVHHFLTAMLQIPVTFTFFRISKIT